MAKILPKGFVRVVVIMAKVRNHEGEHVSAGISAPLMSDYGICTPGVRGLGRPRISP